MLDTDCRIIVFLCYRMSKKTLVYIALTMFMALAGLISVQIYWTRSIFAQNEEYLKVSVIHFIRASCPPGN